MAEATGETPVLEPYEHVFVENGECVLCGFEAPLKLPHGMPFGRGEESFAGVPERVIVGGETMYRGLVEVPGVVVERMVHAGWIDWGPTTAPLCKREPTKPDA